MASKTIKNSWHEEVEVGDEGGLITLRINAERTAYLNLTPEQASELGGALKAFALILEAQESSH
jgi:hypothetical protein